MTDRPWRFAEQVLSGCPARCRSSSSVGTAPSWDVPLGLEWPAVAAVRVEDVFKVSGVPTHTFVRPRSSTASR